MAESEKTSKPSPAPPSEIFLDSVCDGGTPVADCELCGRTHYAASGYCMDEGELEDLEAKNLQEPDKYIPSDCDSISIGHIDGRQIVYGCKCNILSRYERFIWSHRSLIIKYLKKRCAQSLEEARINADEVATVPESIFVQPFTNKRKFDL